MGEPLRIILLIAPLVTGAIAIFFAFQLIRRYTVPFISSYFYYLVFLYIFGTYSLIGSGILDYLIIRLGTPEETIYSVRLSSILVGIPLLLLSKYMLIRSTMDLVNRKIVPSFTIGYLILSVAAVVIYGIFVFRLTRFDLGEYQVIIVVQRWVFVGFMAASYAGVYLLILRFSRKMILHERTFVRLLGFLYLIFMLITCSAYILSELYEIFTFVFIVFFLAWHLIPILFMSLYLEKYHGQTATLQQDFDEQLKAFTEKFEISKREREVIRLICKGLSNQEISDALFISLQTVKDHTHHIFVKSGVKNRVQLTNLIRTN